MTPVYVYMRQTAKRIVSSESCSEVSLLFETWCECWHIKVTEDKTQAVYFSHRLRQHEAHFALNKRNKPFVNHVKYLDVIFNKRIIWRLHVEMIKAKVFRIFTRIYSLFKSKRLNANIKLSLHKTPISAEMTYTCPPWEIAADT
jgi:hypothetical protein